MYTIPLATIINLMLMLSYCAQQTLASSTALEKQLSNHYVNLTTGSYPILDMCGGTNYRCFVELNGAKKIDVSNGTFIGLSVFDYTIDSFAVVDSIDLDRAPLSFEFHNCTDYVSQVSSLIGASYDNNTDYCATLGNRPKFREHLGISLIADGHLIRTANATTNLGKRDQEQECWDEACHVWSDCSSIHNNCDGCYDTNPNGAGQCIYEYVTSDGGLRKMCESVLEGGIAIVLSCRLS